ncbi:MAG: TlpA family protein disulfide reductase [Bryobacteraceae bacterium]|nr:TlpA family protein disulfide reductase [Bryobacteraceae bacterium]MCX7604053.1 TlpA family protein disulfide reductase [Bryobacteraceae bacterium]
MKKHLALLLFFAFAAGAGPLAGKRVASFALPDAQGRYHDVLDYRGKLLLIDIMRTDCPHCIPFAKTLERVKSRYGDRIHILSIVNPPDNQQTVANFVARHKVSYPILFDFGQAVAAMLNITPQNPTIKLPTLLVVDANGIIREDLFYDDTLKNIFDGDGLFRILDRLLAEQGAKK